MPQVGERRPGQQRQLARPHRPRHHVDHPEAPAGRQHPADLLHDRIPVEVAERQERRDHVDRVVGQVDHRAVDPVEAQRGPGPRCAAGPAPTMRRGVVEPDAGLEVAPVVERPQQGAVAAADLEHAAAAGPARRGPASACSVTHAHSASRTRMST